MNASAQKPPLMPWLHRALSQPLTYALMSGGILGLDYLTGPFLMFPILFVIPVTTAAWFYTARWAYALAVLLPVGRFILASLFESPAPIRFLLANALVRIAVLGFLAYFVARTGRQTRELERHVKRLEGILPICMFCKRIRDEHQDWQQLEQYITRHSEADFSHGLCPECAKEHYGVILADSPGVQPPTD